MLPEPSHRKRTRPSLKNTAFSTAVFVVALYMTLTLSVFAYGVYSPMLIAAALVLGVSLFRIVGLRRALPPPYGRGKVTRIDSRRTARDGVLITVGGLVCIVGLFGSAQFASPYLFFFPVAFGLMMGLPLSQVAFFGMVTQLERATGSRIDTITDETAEGDAPVLLKSIEMKPHRPEKPQTRT